VLSADASYIALLCAFFCNTYQFGIKSPKGTGKWTQPHFSDFKCFLYWSIRTTFWWTTIRRINFWFIILGVRDLLVERGFSLSIKAVTVLILPCASRSNLFLYKEIYPQQLLFLKSSYATPHQKLLRQISYYYVTAKLLVTKSGVC